MSEEIEAGVEIGDLAEPAIALGEALGSSDVTGRDLVRVSKDLEQE